MRNITTRLLSEASTPQSLKSKLRFCGKSVTAQYRHYCRSVGCDNCRRHRARSIATEIYDWVSARLPGMVRRARIDIPAQPHPTALLDAIDDARVRIRRALDRRQSADARWGTIRMQGVFRVRYEAGAGWSATYHGIAYIGGAGEIRILDVLGPLVGLRLEVISRAAITAQDIAGHIEAGASITGLSGASGDDLALWFGCLSRRGEHRALAHRRGISR